MNKHNNEIQAYFNVLGEIGGSLIAWNDHEKQIPVPSALETSLSLVKEAKLNKNRIFFIGNGGSAGIASHMATDWMKNGGFTTMSFNDGALLTCVGNDLGFENVFSFPLSRHAKKNDILFAISSSGKSTDILRAVDVAKAAGTAIITLSAFEENNPLRRKGHINFYVPNKFYGFVEIAHLAICHAILDISMGWNSAGGEPVCAPTGLDKA